MKFPYIFILCACVATSASAQTLNDFLAAARSGDSVAQYNTAQCYRHGWGTAVNFSEWLHYLRLSAEGGEQRAQQALANHLSLVAPDVAAYWRGEGEEFPNYAYRSFDEGCYYGEMLGGTRDGYGSFVWDNGTIYTGEWEDGERYGIGVTHFDNQSIYGNHIKGQMSGYGAIIITSEGHYLDGAEGSVCYVGYFEAGLPNGSGTLYNASGEVTYYGTFKDGKPTATYPSEESYSLYRWEHEELPNGDGWEGESYEGVRHGFGIYRWADGAWWCGYWHEGLREGEGLLVRSDGSLLNGTWENGELVEES